MTIKDEIRNIDEQMREAGINSQIQPRRTRKILLTYRGIVLSKKNRHIISRHGGVIPDAKARANQQDIENQIAMQLRAQKYTDAFALDQAGRMLKAKRLNATYQVRFDIYAGNEIRRDLDNQTSTLLDALVEVGALPDDSTKFLKTIVIRHMGLDRTNPRAEITIVIEEDAN